MGAWTWSPSYGRLVRVEISPPHAVVALTITLNLQEMAEGQAQGSPYPPRPTQGV